MVSKERSVLLITEFCSWMILQHLLPAIQIINLTEIKFKISTRWDFRFVLPYQGSEVGLELDGGSIQVLISVRLFPWKEEMMSVDSVPY